MKELKKKVLKEVSIELLPYEFEGYTNCKDIVVKFYNEFAEINFAFDFNEEIEAEDDLLGRTIKINNKTSTNDTINYFKSFVQEISITKDRLVNPENEEEEYYIWSVLVCSGSGNIKIRCNDRVEANYIKDLFVDWRLDNLE